MKNEIWRDIIGYENLYQVSNLGRVKSLDRIIKTNHGERKLKSKLLKPRMNTNGYYIINLSKNNKIKTYRLHQLVAITFLNHKPNGYTMVVDHIDNNPLNNRLDNLQLINQRENSSKEKRGNTNYSSKFIGVNWHKSSKKWISRIYINNKSVYLGYFNDELEAGEHYQIALENIDKYEDNKQFRELVKQKK